MLKQIATSELQALAKRAEGEGVKRGGRGLVIASPEKLPKMDLGRLFVVEADRLSGPMGNLPIAVARFYQSGDSPGDATGKGWTSEPCFLQFGKGEGLRAQFAGKDVELPCAITLTECETGAELHYALTAGTELVEGDMGPELRYEPVESRFQPDLAACPDGTFKVLLKHGTYIRLDREGRIMALADRSGRLVHFERANGLVVGQRTSEGNRFLLEYRAGKLVVARGSAGPIIRYGHTSEGLLSEVSTDAFARSYRYDSKGYLSAVINAKGPEVLVASYDDKGRVRDLSFGGIVTRISYVDSRGAVKINRGEGSTIEWGFDPKFYALRTVSGKNAMLLSRDSTGRLIQLALADVEADGETERFRVGKIIGTKGE
jgi:YD repeat-containing protein